MRPDRKHWCGAGIAAASRVKKSCLVLCTNSVSVDQWKYQFQLWSSLDSRDVSRFTSQQKEAFTGVANVCITTYTMIAYSGRRSEESAKVRGETRHHRPDSASRSTCTVSAASRREMQSHALRRDDAQRRPRLS